MKILVIGGGPAGLSFSILMAERGSSHEIVVIERNAPTRDPGWGVTLRPEALSFLDLEKRVSPQTLEGRAFRYRDELVVDLPNPGPCGLRTLARSLLLKALYDHAASLGVTLRFGTDGARLSESELARYDLVVGADGAKSTIRSRHADAFQPNVSSGKNRYAWLATQVPFHKITVLLADEEICLLAWAYKYTSMMSSFIVECSEKTYQRTGIGQLSREDSCRCIAAAFIRELAGHSVFCGKSLRWQNYSTVSCRNWCHRNMVLVGDAAHTAHFSQGFGTMLAFDDALALDAALADATDLERALRAYEQSQRPKVAVLQETASASMRWGEAIIESAERHDEKRVHQLIAARWLNNAVTPGPMSPRS